MAAQVDRDWKVVKSINLADIFTALSMFAAAMFYIGTVESRVAVLESKAAQQAVKDGEQDGQLREVKTDTKTELSKINDKLDRLIERQVK